MRLAAAVLLLAAAPSVAEASAWAQPKGGGQVIVKWEAMRATRGFDPSGALVDLPGDRTDRALGVFAEYGLTEGLTVQFKGDWQDGEDFFVDYKGRGPAEIGLTWQAFRDDRTAVSLYAGYADAGDGRNAGYAAPGQGEGDWEVRASVGRNLQGVGGPWTPERSFVEVQTARRMRSGLPDETRIDLTAGGHFGADWMVLGQAFGGMTDDDGARWLSIETSVVRRFGDWSVQAGRRDAVAGRETPASSGWILAVWRRF